MEKIDLSVQLKSLFALQQLDTKIFKLQDEITDIPRVIQRLEESFDSKTASLKAADNTLKTILMKKKEKELDLATRESSIAKLQSQLYQMKTNKEYQTMQGEIERAKADKSTVEDDILALFDRIDLENKNVAKEKDALKSEEGLLAREKTALQAQAKEKEAALAVVQKERDSQALAIDAHLLATYEKILKSRGGLALAELKGDACQGCYRVLPSQIINEIRMKQELIYCGNCARMLYCED